MCPDSSRPRYGSGATICKPASPGCAMESGDPSFGQKRASIPKRSPHVGQIFEDGFVSSGPDALFATPGMVAERSNVGSRPAEQRAEREEAVFEVRREARSACAGILVRALGGDVLRARGRRGGLEALAVLLEAL